MEKPQKKEAAFSALSVISEHGAIASGACADLSKAGSWFTRTEPAEDLSGQ